MQRYPLVSILIPLYNAQDYIATTLESSISQSYPNIEIIVVDDGSSDNSADIVKSYADKFSNIRLYHQQNLGAPRARNLAFEKSNGEYIQYLDADDLLSKNKIFSQMQKAKEYKYNPNIIFSSKFSYFINSIDDAKYYPQSIDHSYSSGIEWLIDAWSGGGFGAVMGWLTHRELIKKAGRWNETLKRNQDGEFFCRVLLNAKEVIMRDDIMVYYRRVPNSISSSKTKESIYSLLESLNRYQYNIEGLNNYKLKEALAISYANFIKEYHILYPDVTKEAHKQIKKLGFDIDKLPFRGKFGVAVKMVGFYNALRVYNLFK